MGNAMQNSVALRRDQSGTTLIEVLITVVLMSIGLLGLAGLQVMSVQNSNSSGERFEATTLARDILERMRANRSQAVAQAPIPNYDLVKGANPASVGLANVDLVAWKTAVEGLPGGQGSVGVDVNDDTKTATATINIFWTDASNDNAGDSRDMSITLSAGL
jgi:type IV pilus assembly protein PilV